MYHTTTSYNPAYMLRASPLPFGALPSAASFSRKALGEMVALSKIKILKEII